MNVCPWTDAEYTLARTAWKIKENLGEKNNVYSLASYENSDFFISYHLILFQF